MEKDSEDMVWYTCYFNESWRKLHFGKNVIGYFPLVFILSLCVFFWWLGTGSLTWKRMTIPLAFALGCLWKTSCWRFIQKIPLECLLPVLLAFYWMLSPGMWLADIEVGYKALVAYLLGVAAIVFIRSSYWIAVLGLPVALTLSYIGFKWGILSDNFVTYDNRLTLFLKYPNILGGIAACALLFLVAYREKWRGILLYPVWGVGIFSFWTLLLSASRIAYLACFVSLIFLSFPFLKRHVASVTFLAVLGCGVAIMAIPEVQLARVESALLSPLEDRTFETRKPIWETAVAGIKQAPWFGNSITAFEAFHHNYVKQHASRLHNQYREVEPLVFHPHNLLLGLLFMGGIVGTSLFVLCAGVALRKAFKQKDRFFQSMVLFYIILGTMEFFLDREDGIVMLFFPMGLVYGREVVAALQGQFPAQQAYPRCGETQ